MANQPDDKGIDKSLESLSIITRGMKDNLAPAAADILAQNLKSLYSKIESHSTIIQNHRTPTDNSNKSLLTKLMATGVGEDVRDIPDLETDLDGVRNYLEKYYTTLRDYETIPSLIPQVTRVLNFLVNEVVSPDIHNKKSFAVNADDDVMDEINTILEDHKLYNLLGKIVEERFRLGRSLYRVQGYSTLFNMIGNMNPSDIMLNESTGRVYDNIEDNVILENVVGKVDLIVPVEEGLNNLKYSEKEASINLESLGITIEYGAAFTDYSKLGKTAVNVLNETSKFSTKSIYAKKDKVGLREVMLAESYRRNGENSKIIQESTRFDDEREKIVNISKELSKKDNIRRALVIPLDPARVFPLKTSNRIVGYFYCEDDQEESKVISFNDLLAKQLKNAKIGKDAYQAAEERVSQKVAKFIIDSAKKNLEIEDIDDLDLFANYISSNKVTLGKKKYRFYHKDDIVDISREKGSLLINSVYQAKLAAVTMHNNVVTKLTKGRDREIFTVKTGGSANVSPYLYNAMDVLASGNDGVYRALNGPIAKILNPFQNSTIIIPTDEGADEYIKADIIQGQDVDMDMEFVKFLINNIITSYGVDPGVVDLLNQSVDFAKSLTMINKEMLILNINEQADLLPGFRELVLSILYEEGSDRLRDEIDSDKVIIKLFEPKSLLLDIVQNEFSNAKGFADAIVELHPILNTLEEDNELSRKIALYKLTQEYVSANFGDFDNIIHEALTTDYSTYNTELKMHIESRNIAVNNVDEEENTSDMGSEEDEEDIDREDDGFPTF